MNPDALAARIGNVLGSLPSGSAQHLPSPPPSPIPHHEIIAHIGGGSYGEVWLARSITGAFRAVKVVWRRQFSNDRPYEREFRGIVQFEPLSRSHPGLIHVLHVGRDDAAGCFFYVMELADDAQHPCASTMGRAPAPSMAQSYRPRTLASDLISRTRLPVSEVVSLGVQLASALGHLHRHGLVHRDVKPSNVIFVLGQAKLADIGLVTGIHDERSFVGTEGFIPPEGPGSERADLFALGRLLYEAATGKNRCDFPGLPDDLDRWPNAEREALIELNEVLARACAPNARKRHSNAADLAGDLNLILAGRSVRRAYGIERQLRRATIISVAALLLVLAAIVSNGLQRRHREASELHARREAALRAATQMSLARAQAAERQSEHQLFTALLEQARATVLTAQAGHRLRALDALRRAGAISNTVSLRAVALAALALPDLALEREWPTSPDTTLACLDPAFERIALSRAGGPVEIRSLHDQRLLVTLPASTNSPAQGRWSPDGRFLAVAREQLSPARDKDVEVWLVEQAQRLLLLPACPGGARSFHPRLPRILISGPGAAAALWDLQSAQELARYELEATPVALEFAPDGRRFAAVLESSQEWIISIHDATDGTRVARHVLVHRARELDWHPNGHGLAVPDFSGAVHWMDAQTGQTRLLGRHNAAAVFTVFSPDGRYLFSGGWDRALICWDVQAMRRAFTAHLESYHVQFRADGRQCAILVWPEMHLQFHSFERPALSREFAEDLGGGRNYAAFSPDGRWLAARGEGCLVTWDLTSVGPGAVVKDVAGIRPAFAANGELFASRDEHLPSARSSECFRWRPKPGTNGAAPGLERLPMSKPDGFVSLCPAHNSIVLTSTNGSKVVNLHQLTTDTGPWRLTADGLNGASPDGLWLGVYRSYTPHLYVYRLPAMDYVAKLTTAARISLFEFSPRGDELAVANRDGVEFWSTTTWQRTRHLTNFNGILYSPDGLTAWLYTRFRAAGLHEARTGEPLLPLPAGVVPLAVSAGGRLLATSADARRVQVWDMAEVRLRLRELGLDWAGSQ